MKALYKPMLSPLQLDRYFLKGLNFQLKDGFDRGEVSAGMMSSARANGTGIDVRRRKSQAPTRGKRDGDPFSRPEGNDRGV